VTSHSIKLDVKLNVLAKVGVKLNIKIKKRR